MKAPGRPEAPAGARERVEGVRQQGESPPATSVITRSLHPVRPYLRDALVGERRRLGGERHRPPRGDTAPSGFPERVRRMEGARVPGAVAGHRSALPRSARPGVLG
ncbi:hypothetical protein GCM10022244_39560 [Streptomyces gulbargensis]|uniref:Uncharacterized protein n=1 Tax=Streptomyces gulbargensis TaxID=364901 RepID=A0ABP7MMI9_9ACTN